MRRASQTYVVGCYARLLRLVGVVTRGAVRLWPRRRVCCGLQRASHGLYWVLLGVAIVLSTVFYMVLCTQHR